MSNSTATPQPVATLDFARHVLATVEKHRAAQLRSGSITQEQHDADVTAARELVLLAEDALIFNWPPLN